MMRKQTKLMAEAHMHMPQGVAENYRDWGPERTVFIQSAKGCWLTDCDGKRYRPEVLEIRLTQGRREPRNIAEVLELTVAEAVDYFGDVPEVVNHPEWGPLPVRPFVQAFEPWMPSPGVDHLVEHQMMLDSHLGIPWKGNYSSWLEQKDERLKQEEATESARQKTIKRELEWVRQNAKGRQAKSKARLARFEELNSYEYQKRNETQEIFIPVADRLGDSVIEFDHVSKSFGDRLLMDDLSFSVPPGAIVGIIGPNGAGKSTLFRMIAGSEKPAKGEVKIGQTVKLAVVDQSRDDLEADKTVFDFVANGADVLKVGKFEMPARAYLGRFNFKGPDQGKKVGNLSGGERGRLHLAKTLIQGGNVLLLDEPSNDLDVETLRALEDALLEFAGSVMVISHDRWFLDRIATHILAAEGDSQWVFFDGNYQEYEADKKKRLGEEGAKPHRGRFKALK